VLEFWSKLFASDFMPHGHCYLWRPDVLWLQVSSDALIALSYYSIPFTLSRFVSKRREDLPFVGIFLGFVLFILACGTTHLMNIWTIWHGTYRLEGVLKGVTGVLSAMTAIGMIRLMPQALLLPSPRQLANANEHLSAEIAHRRVVEDELNKVHAELEQRVIDRTRQLGAANQALSDSESQVRKHLYEIEQIYSAVPVAIGFVNQRLGFARISASLIELGDLAFQQNAGDCEFGVSSQYAAPFLRCLETGIPLVADAMKGSRQGAARDWQLSLYPMRDSEGVLQGLHVVVVDVTEQRRMEDQLRQAQKMEAIGRLAGGVAHDFNNLLTVIGGYGHLLLERAGNDNSLNQPVQEVLRAADHATQLTRQLLAFGRRQIIRPEVVNLNTVVESLKGTLRRLIEENINLLSVLDAHLGKVRVDVGQFSQVLMNLVLNARDAITGSGTITIETANVRLDAEHSKTHLDLPAGDYVTLTITDTGSGMDNETRLQIFEPFFTTKEQGRGTGLGLATVYGIVKQNMGSIWVYSEPGQGSMFKVYLPRVPDEERLPVGNGEVKGGSGANPGERILVVEDEPALRELVCVMLRGLGYQTVDTGSPEEAISLMRNPSEEVSLLLTDLVMPKMSGTELKKHLSVMRPGLRVLFMSGYPDWKIADHGLSDPHVAFLQKPFTQAALRQAVRKVLDE